MLYRGIPCTMVYHAPVFSTIAQWPQRKVPWYFGVVLFTMVYHGKKYRPKIPWYFFMGNHGIFWAGTHPYVAAVCSVVVETWTIGAVIVVWSCNTAVVSVSWFSAWSAAPLVPLRTLSRICETAVKSWASTWSVWLLLLTSVCCNTAVTSWLSSSWSAQLNHQRWSYWRAQQTCTQSDTLKL